MPFHRQRPSHFHRRHRIGFWRGRPGGRGAPALKGEPSVITGVFYNGRKHLYGWDRWW